jgi:hypothetical protein
MVGISSTMMIRTPITPPMDIPTIIGHLFLFFSCIFFLVLEGLKNHAIKPPKKLCYGGSK